MVAINAVLRPLFDAILGLTADWPVWVGVLLWSIPVSVFALWIFKRASNQDRITAVKAKIHACLFEIRLFNDDIRAIFRAQWEIIGHVLHYQMLAFKPMIWILPPLVMVMVQLLAFYGFRGLEPGESALVTVTTEEMPANAQPDLDLIVPNSVIIETPGVWAKDLGQMAWRIRADEPGAFTLQVMHDGAAHEKSLEVTDRTIRLSPERPGGSFLGQLEWPSETPLSDASGLRSITLSYPEATLAFLGLEMESQWAWMILFFILTMIIALALKKPMGVEL